MVHKKETGQPELKLPMLIFGVVEVRRLKRELEVLEDFVHQATIREPGKQAPLPRVSRLLEALATDNNLQLLQHDHRAQLKAFLEYIETKAPKLHISFAIDPSSAFTAKIVIWMRANIHPHVLLEVGLQPTIAAGCIVRTTNKVFDFSLRERFKDASTLLVKALQAAGDGGVVSMAAMATAPSVPVVTPAVVPVTATMSTEAAVAAAVPKAAPAASIVTNVEDIAAQLAMPAADEAATVAQNAQSVQPQLQEPKV